MLRNSEAVNCSFGPTGLGNLRSGYTRFGLGNGSFRSRSVEGVNSPVALSMWVIRYIEVWQLTLPHAVELLAIHGPVRDPCLLDIPVCSVEPTLLLPLAVMLATDTRPRNSIPIKIISTIHILAIVFLFPLSCCAAMTVSTVLCMHFLSKV